MKSIRNRAGIFGIFNQNPVDNATSIPQNTRSKSNGQIEDRGTPKEDLTRLDDSADRFQFTQMMAAEIQ